jgi:hypothetical protein
MHKRPTHNSSIGPLPTAHKPSTIYVMDGISGDSDRYERRARFATFGVAFAAAVIAIAMNRMQTPKTGVTPQTSVISVDATVSFG